MNKLYDEFTTETASQLPWPIEQVDWYLALLNQAGASPDEAAFWLRMMAKGYLDIDTAIFAVRLGAKSWMMG